jgi:hypothetical protein
VFDTKPRVPAKRVREKSLIIYELEGCQKAVNFLSAYYDVRKMKIVLDGKKVGKRYYAIYSCNKAYFTKKGLKKKTVLHELYHHLVKEKGLELSDSAEERQAIRYARDFLE